MAFEETLKGVMDVLAEGFSQETVKKNKDSFDRLKSLYEEHPHDFVNIIQVAEQRMVTLIEQVMNVPDSENEYLLEHIVSGLYKHFHTQRIEKMEGSVCCYDKSSFIESRTLLALKKNENISLFDDYQKSERIKEDKTRQAYWSPQTVTDTDEAMKLFWDWYLMHDLTKQMD